MAYFSVAPTLCEVTYDSNRDEKVTPYRYQCRSANSRATNGITSPSFTEIVNVSLPSGYNVSYYEYLRTLYDSRISSPTKASGHYPSGASPGPGHYSARSFHPPHGNNFHSKSPQIYESRPRTAGPYLNADQLPPSLPSIHHGLYHSSWGEDEDMGSGEGSRHSEDRLKWIDALNKWIPEQNQSRAGYVSFVGNAPMVEKLLREHAASQKNRDFLSQDERHICERFEQHMLSMKLQNQSKHHSPEHAFARRLMTLKKREALRRRNAEMLELRKQRKDSSSPHSPVSDKRLKVRFKTPALFPKKTVPNKDLISIPKESWGAEKPESDPDSSRLDGSESDSRLKQAEDDLELKGSESENSKKGSSSSGDKDGSEKSSSHHSSGSLPPVAMETTNKDAEDEEENDAVFEEPKLPTPQPGLSEPEVPEPVQSRTETASDKSLVEVESLDNEPVEPKGVENEPVEKLVLPDPLQDSESELDREAIIGGVSDDIQLSDRKSKKVKKASSNKLTVSKVKSVMQTDKKGSKSKTKVGSKVSSRKLKNGKGESDEEDGDEKGGGRGGKEEDGEKEEPPVAIPMIGDTKTGPLSLIAGQDNHRREPVKKTRVSASDALAKKRQANRNLEKKRAPKPPSPPPRPPTPPTPEPEKPATDISTAIATALPTVNIEEPPLPDPSLLTSKPTSPVKNNRSLASPIKLQQRLINKRKSFKRDTSYEDELRRQELLEKRRQKQMELLEKMKSRQGNMSTEVEYIDGVPSFDDYGFLAKYCIFNRGMLEMYKRTFEVVDDECKGWLNGIEAMIALRGVNNRLTMQEEEYLYRILEVSGYNISKGADFKLFSVLAALSHRISAVDDWMKLLIDTMDFRTLEMKTFMCKRLWECNVDNETNRISLEQLCIELRAGGISEKHEREVREKLGHLKSLDLLDFLTYVPLFIMIHQSVVDNPLNDVRDK
ncbi:neurofilament medium polypeptide-like isoform X8 [Crassostrea angulata]|uniref:neurofilament medium polypeptide-like isoform X8 n=1 Tax=Magallana angulata TaxID=2784310 RepID=UPI0022B18F2D|nr:neurofilament medium polypeptide-like isoform X8 [Crassostrea angulata]